MTHPSNRPAGWLRALCLAGAFLLAGCGPSLHKVVREAPTPGGFVAVEAAEAGNIVSVRRGGQPLDLRLPLLLQPGDVIETGQGGAVLRLPNGEAVMGPRTRVRVGSLEVVFGRLFASVRGLFRAEDENVAADVEGTEFLFEHVPGKGTQVVVLDGTVRCSSKRGQWAPLRVTAGRRMSLDYRTGSPPRLEPAGDADLARIRAWADTIRAAPQAGYCCAGGQVYPALSTGCRGHFSSSEREARWQCSQGWCCQGGRVSPSLRVECGGSFHDSQRQALAACAEPVGWCCQDGQLSQATRSRCPGQFFGSDGAAAKQACSPPPASIRGTIVEPAATPSTILRIFQMSQVWCCIGGEVTRIDRASCSQRQGTAYADEDSARRSCLARLR
jgi:hypothetical protein